MGLGFQSPLWLLAILPWGVLAVYLRRGRPATSPVPFVALWRGNSSDSSRRATKRFTSVLTLLAILMTLLALASPALPGTRQARSLTLIIDRGLTMSAEKGGQVRFRELGASVARGIDNQIDPNLVTVRFIPALVSAPLQVGWAHAIASAPRTALDTSSQIAAVGKDTAHLKLSPDGIALVLTDQRCEVTDPNSRAIRPGERVDNAGILQVAIRNEPKPQMLVRLRNDSPQTRATLESPSFAGPKEIELPARGKTRDYFIDLSRRVAEASIHLRPGGEIDADDTAWATARAQPRVEVRGNVGEPLDRMANVYNRNRPSDASEQFIGIYPVENAPDSKVRALIVGPPDLMGSQDSIDVSMKDLQSSAGTFSDGVVFPELMRTSDAMPAGAGWEPVLTVANHLLAAKRTTPARQVWVNLTSDAWTRQRGFVVFYTKVLDWLSERSDGMQVAKVESLDESWARESAAPDNVEGRLWPGIFVRGGERRASIAPAMASGFDRVPEWREWLAERINGSAPGRSASPWITCLALGLMSIGFLRRSLA